MSDMNSMPAGSDYKQKDRAKKNRSKNKNGGKPEKYSDKSESRAKKSSDNKGRSSTTAASALLQSAANISFPTTVGLPINLAGEDQFISRTGAAFRVPGMMTFGFVPTPGKCRDWSDPFNVWLRDIYTFIRHANSGHSNYDATNLGQYFLVYDSCLTYLSWMRRLAGLVTLAALPQNAYTPRDLVVQCGGDYDDLLANLANFRTYINTFAVRLNAMKVPNMNFFGSHQYLVENVFKDSNIAKASMYVFNPDGFWQYHLGKTPEDTYLHLNTPEGGSLNYIRQFGEILLNTLLNNEDFNVMSGDIMKAYSDYAVPPLMAEDYGVLPVFDPAILLQIHNATVIYQSRKDAINNMREWKIREDMSESTNVGAMIFDATLPLIASNGTDALIDQSLVYAAEKKIVDMPFDDPSAAEVGFVSRFMLCATLEKLDEKEGDIIAVIDSHGSEILTSCHFVYEPGNANPNGLSTIYLPMLSQIDMHPIVPQYTIVYALGDDKVVVGGSRLMGEITNCTAIGNATLRNIHYATMLDLFGLSMK